MVLKQLSTARRFVTAVGVTVGSLISAPGWAVDCEQGTPLFRDAFDSATLGRDWSWVREEPGDWQLSAGRLGIRSNGSLWEKENTQRNILLTELPNPQAPGLVVEVTVDGAAAFDQRYEHAGLIWYWDDDNWVTLTHLNHVNDKTRKIVLVQEAGGKGLHLDSKAAPYEGPRVSLCLIFEGNRLVGHYRRRPGDMWEELGAVTLGDSDGVARVGLTAGEGVAEARHWAWFDDFQVLQAKR